jgi:hypothetical protein
MKITKARLKEIIKEELARMNEAVSGLSGDLGAEDEMALRGLPGAVAARKQHKAINAPRRGLSPEAEEAMAGLADMGVTDARGNLARGKVIPDVADALAKMGVTPDVMKQVLNHFEALYR